MAKNLSSMLKKEYPDNIDSEIISEVEYLDTGIPTMNYVLSGRPLTGGIPLSGKMVCMYGPEGCLDESTDIQYVIRDINTGKEVHHSHGTIKHLYERYKGICKDKRSNKINRDEVEFYINSIDEETNRIIRQPIADVVHNGEKECFELITKSGRKIIATDNHKFYIGNNIYKELRELKVDDVIYIHDNTTAKKDPSLLAKKNRSIKYKDVCVKYLPNVDSIKIVNGCEYKREKEHILIYEAHLNNMKYKDFRNLLNDVSKKEYIDTLKFIDKSKYDVHHLDEDIRNNDINNLVLMSRKDHNRLHALKNIRNLSYIAIEDNIKSITSVGIRNVYDIKCFEPYNSYIANGFVVHNCGKTSYVNHLIAIAQKKDYDIVYIDSECSVTRPRLKQFGVNIDELNYIVPDNMEQVFDIIERVCRYKIKENDDRHLIIIWDSIAQTATSDEMNRTAFDKEIGSQSAVLTRGLRRIKPYVHRCKTTGLVFINQARENQDRFGDLYKMPGGKALMHSCDIILRVNKLKPNETEQGIKISTPSKNRLFNPFQSTVVQFNYALGFTKENIVKSFCEFIKEIGILGQSGAWCFLQTDVNKMMSEGMSEEDAKKEVKKFYLKDFTTRLLEEPEYYEQLLHDSEEYVNKNISMVSKIMLDSEINIESELKKISEVENEFSDEENTLEKDEKVTKKVKSK